MVLIHEDSGETKVHVVPCSSSAGNGRVKILTRDTARMTTLELEMPVD